MFEVNFIDLTVEMKCHKNVLESVEMFFTSNLKIYLTLIYIYRNI
jgi:hypothetical protein